MKPATKRPLVAMLLALAAGVPVGVGAETDAVDGVESTGLEAAGIQVDPRCPHCRRLLDKLPALAERYRFRLVPLPVLGPSSEAAVAPLDCLSEKDQAARPQGPPCRHLRSDPNARGRLQEGVPADLEAWPEGK